MVLHEFHLQRCERAADESPQLRGVFAAFLEGLRRYVLLHVCRPEALASPLAQCGDGVGLNTHHGGHLARPITLDLEVPEHLLPTLGQGREGTRDDSGVHLTHHGVVKELDSVQFALLPGFLGLGPTEVIGTIGCQTGHGGDQVCAQELSWTATGLQEREYPGEGLRGDVLRLSMALGVKAGNGEHCTAMALVQFPKCLTIADADSIQ